VRCIVSPLDEFTTEGCGFKWLKQVDIGSDEGFFELNMVIL